MVLLCAPFGSGNKRGEDDARRVASTASFLGGKATLYDCGVHSSVIQGRIDAGLRCKGCEGSLKLIIQLYAPYKDAEHRSLYVFGCDRCEGAKGSWTVFRDQQSIVDEAAADLADTALEKTAPSKWCDASNSSAFWASSSGADGWGSGVSGVSCANVTNDDLDRMLNELEISTVSSSSPGSKRAGKGNAKGTNASDLGTLPQIFLDTFEEPSQVTVKQGEFSHEKRLLEKYNAEQAKLGEETVPLDASSSSKFSPPTDASKGASREVYESVPSDLKYMLRFQKRVARVPSQCVRYAYCEEPLLPLSPSVSKKVVGAECKTCKACGAVQQFEFQILPQSISLICPDGGMDFASVLIFSCSESCGVGFEECAVVVPDAEATSPSTKTSASNS